MNLEPIDTSTTAGKARVMQLAAEGRKVATRLFLNGGSWRAVKEGDQLLWNWGNNDYAIIAEPVGPDEVWCVVNGNTVLSGWNTEDGCKSGVKTPAQAAVRYIRADLAGEVS